MRTWFLAAFMSSIAVLLSCAAGLAQSQEKPLKFEEYKEVVNSVSIKDHTMPLDKFKQALEKPNLVILDLRSDSEYKTGHIKGALNFGADVTNERLDRLVPDKKATVVVYCTNTFMPTRRISLNFACLPQIIALGYPNVFVLEDLWSKDFKEMEKFKTSPLWQTGSLAK